MELDLCLDVVHEEQQQPEREPTVLEYARFYGLCEDYTSENVPRSPVIILSDEAFDQHLRDPPDVPTTLSADNYCAHELIKEPIAISVQSALLLKSVFSLPDPLGGGDVVPIRRERSRGMKLEEPVLRTDNELDLLAFGNADTPDLANLQIPLEPAREGEREGMDQLQLGWDYATLKDEWARLESARLEVKRGHLLYLQDAIKDAYTSEDEEGTKVDALRWARVMREQ